MTTLTFHCDGLPVPSIDAGSGPKQLAPALDLLAAIRSGREGDDDALIALVHPGEPVSKARARFTRHGHAYTPQRTSASEQSLAYAFRGVTKGRTLEGNIAIVAVFYRATYQRVDADNLMKLVMDAATKARVWNDDSQVTAQAAVIELDHENPRTVIALGRTDSTMVRGARTYTKACARCGVEFTVDAKAYRRVYCKPKCAQPRVKARCARCGTEFARGAAGQRYCSKKCVQADPLVRQKIAASRPHATCVDCGGRVSRREYIRCSNCSTKGRRIGSKNKPKATA